MAILTIFLFPKSSLCHRKKDQPNSVRIRLVVVPLTGLEPVRYLYRGILRHLRPSCTTTYSAFIACKHNILCFLLPILASYQNFRKYNRAIIKANCFSIHPLSYRLLYMDSESCFGYRQIDSPFSFSIVRSLLSDYRESQAHAHKYRNSHDSS